MSDYITTYRKVHFTPLAPKAEDIFIEDIAHALSLMTRANGHFPVFHSVAQHCLECAEEARCRGLSVRTVLACLLHDAGEAYMADVTRPVKAHLSTYREIEDRLLETVYDRFLGGLSKEEAAAVKDIDDTLLYYEFLHFMGEALFENVPTMLSSPTFETISFEEGERRYLRMFEDLQKGL